VRASEAETAAALQGGYLMDSVAMTVQFEAECDVYYDLDRGDPNTGQGSTVEIDDIRLNGVEVTDEVSDHEKRALEDQILTDWLEGEPHDED
jgi:hypothetical protein